MLKKFEEFNEYISRLFNTTKKVKSVTFQVTDDCNLACTYCYQINKGTRSMSKEVALKAINCILDNAETEDGYLSYTTTSSLIIEFIGGEPLMEIELINFISEEFEKEMIKRNSPFLFRYKFNITTNGVLYMNKEVQKYIKKYNKILSIGITLDGNKELHDKCRLFKDGRGSHSIVEKACKYDLTQNKEANTKITLAPENLSSLYDAVLYMYDLGYLIINANPVYEKVWEIKHSIIYYEQLIKLADHFLKDENIHLVTDSYFKLFQEINFLENNEEQNYCGGTGDMVAIDPEGFIYPCLRYMSSSLGPDIKPLIIGDIYKGFEYNEEQKDCVSCLKSITKSSQSEDKCITCPISMGCGWCSAYNYQETGSVNKRVTFICIMQKANSLANVYFWNNYYRRIGDSKRFPLNCPKDWALEIISEEEYNKLYELSL